MKLNIYRFGGAVVIGALVSEVAGQRLLLSALLCVLWMCLLGFIEGAQEHG
jgi:hypothetical protein